MSRPEKEILDRLGDEGLARALADLLDQNRLVRLANGCGLKYPGMRTRSQKRDRILTDLVQRAGQESSARKAILRALQKETRAAAREWSALSPDERQQRLADDTFLLSNGQLARHLVMLAASTDAADHEGLKLLLARQKELGRAGADPAKSPAARPSRETTRLNRRITELQKKVQHLENQLGKSRESEKTIKRELVQRKSELAKALTQADRLSKEMEKSRLQLQRARARSKAGSVREADATQVAKAVKQLAAGQKKLAQRIERLAAAPAAPETPSERSIQSLAESLSMLQAELTAMRRESKRLATAQNKRIDALRTRIEEGATALRPRATRNGDERVGVFIDVQNMYYGARRLKGKLDFDALLQAAVRDRRLIQANAYVVESAEIDQSGFIAILRKLAIDVRRKTLQVRADGSMKGDWDMDLALDILDAAPDLDVVVLVSGDGDFTSLVQRVKRIGPRVEVIGFPRNTAKSLLEAADEFQPLNRKFMIYTDSAKARTARRAKRTAKKRPAAKGAPGKPADEPA
jgi:uncharacterized LabA/DUF88 family protein